MRIKLEFKIEIESDDETILKTIKALGIWGLWEKAQRYGRSNGGDGSLLYFHRTAGKFFGFREFTKPGDSGMAQISCPLSCSMEARMHFFRRAELIGINVNDKSEWAIHVPTPSGMQ